jgi:hypothetical protein
MTLEVSLSGDPFVGSTLSGAIITVPTVGGSTAPGDLDKYYIDLSPDPSFSADAFITIHPESLSFDDEIRAVGNCSFQISFSATDIDGSTIISGHDVFGPYRTWSRLRYGNTAIQAGPLVSTNTILGTDFMSCATKTWEHYFERWEYPFDGRDLPLPNGHVNDYQHPFTYQGDEISGSGVATPTGLAYQATNRDVIRIISDLVSTTMNAGNRVIFDLSNLTGLSGIKTNFQLSLGDNTKLFQIINDLSGLGDGFDWWISHDMKFYWATPYRFGNPANPTITYTFDSTHMPNDLAFTNNGPKATHVQGRGAGLASSTTLSRAYGYAPSQTQFSRLDESYDFGDIRNATELIAKTKKQLSLDLNPQHEIPMTVDPSRIASYWANFRKGRAIYIDMEMVSHRIDSAQRLTKYSGRVDSEGDALVDFTLDQIYETSATVGVAEG